MIPSDGVLPLAINYKFGVVFNDPNDAINWSLRLIRAIGYKVVTGESEEVEKKETPAQYRARLNISAQTFSRRINDPNCPTFLGNFGPTGRIISLTSNPVLDEFMKKLQ